MRLFVTIFFVLSVALIYAQHENDSSVNNERSAKLIEGFWSYPKVNVEMKISKTGNSIICEGDNGTIHYNFSSTVKPDLYKHESIPNLYLKLVDADQLMIFNIETKKKNVWQRLLKEKPVIPEQNISNSELEIAEQVANELGGELTSKAEESLDEKVDVENVDLDINIDDEMESISTEDLAEPNPNFNIGDQVYWTENETYKTGSSGNMFGDMLLGDLYKSTYTIEYVAIVEQLIGDNVKVLITDVGMKRPKWASMNYLDAEGEVMNSAMNKIGQTRVKPFDQVVIFK